MKPFISILSICIAFVLPVVQGSALAANQGPDISNINDNASVHLRAGDLPTVTLTSSILFHILLAELSAQRGDFSQAAQIFTELARTTLDPRLAKRGFQAAMVTGDMAQAYKAAREWEMLDPQDPEAVASSLALAATSGHTAGLASALAERIASAANKEEAIMQASAIVHKMPDQKVAFKVLDQVITPQLKQLPLARMALADAAWAAQDQRRAYFEAQEALRLDESSEAAAQRVLEYGLAVDSDAAIKTAENWIHKNPESRKMHLMLVSRLVRLNEFNAALGHIKAMRERSPEDFDLLYTEAEVHMQAQNYSMAKDLLNTYINVQNQRRESLNDNATNALGDASDARLLLVKIAEQEENITEAVRQLDLIDDPAMRFQAQMHKAVLLGRTGNLPEAHKTIDAARPIDDRERSVAALTLASVYRAAGRTETAVELLFKADKELPNTPEIKYDLAMLYVHQGNQPEFEKLMYQVIDLDPENANAYNSLGYTLVDQNLRLDEARELLEYALELDPGSPYILDSVGWYFYRVNDLEAALSYLQRAYDQMPDAEVGAHLGEVLWLSKKQDEARRVWSESLAKDPTNESLLKTLKRFGVSLP